MEKRYIHWFLVTLLSFAAPVYGISAESPEALFNAGVKELKTGEPQKAVDLFTELVMNEPGNANVHKNRGVALMKLGKIDLAIRDFEKGLALNPDLPGLYTNLGAAWFYKGEYEKAINSYDCEIAKMPKNHVSYFDRALCRMQLSQLKPAMEDIERCLELRPDFSEALLFQKKIPGYEIQTGAFLNQNNAVDMVNELEQKGIGAHISTHGDGKKRTWYLVRFGLFADKEDARLYCERFVEQQQMAAIVRPWGRL